MAYKNQAWSFSDYDASSNPYIVEPGTDGLQYILTPTGTDAYISTDSDYNTQKQNMINRALTALEGEGVTSGYVDLENTTSSSKYTIYILLIVLLLLFIGGIVTYAAYKESKM